MSLYYPQCAVILRVTWEDFKSKDVNLSKVQDIRILAKMVRVDRNDYSEADKCKLTIDYSAFPFDPRCIRALGISIFMQDKKSLFKDDGSHNTIVPNDLDIDAKEANKIFVGFADESSISIDENERNVEIEGRDYTCLFIDQKRLSVVPMSLSKPIDQVIKDIINEQEATKSIEVINRTGQPLPTITDLAEDFNEETGKKNPKRKETYWDAIQNILGNVGLIGFIELDKFIVTKPQNIYEKKEIKQFIWGKNIKSVKFSRKLGRAKDFNVKVVSLYGKDVLEAMIPKEATDPNIAGPEVTIPQLDKDGKKIEPEKIADYVTFFVKDVHDKDELIKIGESIFTEMGRQQIDGSLSTYEMEIPDESKKDPVKFSEIRNGTAIRVYFESDEISKLSSDSSKEDKRNFLIKRGYPVDVATSFAESLDRINTAFYTKSVSFQLDETNGFQMDIEFINFIDLDSSLKT